MKNKILILGRGFIGERLKEALGCDISGKRIYSFKDARSIIKKHKPKIIINCIGHTGAKNVDGCEQDIDKTLMANTFIPIILAEVCLRYKIKLVHISSGCIFKFNYHKDRPITENKIPDFFDLFYSRSKIYSERSLSALLDKYNILIARIRVPLDDRPHPKNLLTKLLKYEKIVDIPNSITYIPDFIKALKHLIKIDAKGIYNVANKGGLKYPLLLKVYEKYTKDLNYDIVSYKSLGLVRTNLVLSTKRLEKSGFKIRTIKEVLEECVRAYLKY